MKNRTVLITLRKDYILIKLKDDCDYEDIVEELRIKLPDLKAFYQEEKKPIMITGKTLKAKQMDEIKDMIQKTLNVKVEFDMPRDLGIAAIKRNFRKQIKTSETSFYKSSIRSGQKIEFEGSVVVIGDVNDGAEIIAQDHIIVLGALRGLAHAGARGNQEAIISAKIIDSPQLRIASVILERSREEIRREAYTFAYVNDDNSIELE